MAMTTDEVATGQRRHDGGRWPRASIAVVVLVLLAVPWLLPVPTTVESVDTDGSRWIRVELPEFYERGPDPSLVVEALRRHDVPVEEVRGRDAEGGYSVDPARFRGSVSITVGVAPWDSAS